MNELEEYRSRCDELFADLLDCQEQLRNEQMKQLSASESSPKRPHLSAPPNSLSLALLRIDCQHVMVFLML